MPITIRRGTALDARAPADLWLRARKHAVGTIPAPVHSDDDVRNWFAGHVVPDTELWVAIDHAGGPVGILVLDGDWIDQLYVEPSMAGQGIGSQLVALARRQRPHGLRLWTFVSNVRAQRFYERHGFVEIDRTDGRDNEEGAPDISTHPSSRRVAQTLDEHHGGGEGARHGGPALRANGWLPPPKGRRPYGQHPRLRAGDRIASRSCSPRGFATPVVSGHGDRALHSPVAGFERARGAAAEERGASDGGARASRCPCRCAGA
jgi:GNAT superfamily N-acetyltransferase